jgi:hypothetical protein
MKHGFESSRSKRAILSLLAASCLVIGSPVGAVYAAKGGAQKPVSATHGDCKNNNSGKHKGYVCPSGGGETIGGDTGGGGDDEVLIF